MTMLTRRQFGKSTGLGLLALSTTAETFLTGCLFSQSTISEIEAYVNLGLTALQSVMNVLAANNIQVADGSNIEGSEVLIKAGFADLNVAISDYNAAPASGKASAEAQVATVLQIISNRIGQFWNSLNLPDGNAATVVAGLLGVITTTLAGFMTQLPAPAVTIRKVGLSARITGAPVKRNKKQFVHDFNIILESNKYAQFDLK